MSENSRERGGPIGSPEEDWTQAEQDLRNDRTQAVELPLFTFFSCLRSGSVEGRCDE
jgi:hypothetical protein